MRWPLTLLALLAGCGGDFPRDVEGTRERVERERVFKVAIVAGTPAEEAGAMLARVARASGARPEISHGATEPLLRELEEGNLDLVIAPMHRKSGWKMLVHFLPPLEPDLDVAAQIDLVAMARNGENGWISLLDREARAVGEMP
jgi:hypothetical protein